MNVRRLVAVSQASAARKVRWLRSAYDDFVTARASSGLPSHRRESVSSVISNAPANPVGDRRDARSEPPALPIHFGPSSQSRFGWYHPSTSGASARAAGIVLCNTLGNESLRAFGTLRHTAEKLALAGFCVLRFDFLGTGDSDGSEADPERIATWLGDIDLAIEELRVRSGVKAIGIAGLRLGGTLAMIAAARRNDVESVVLWDPYYSGREFVDETLRLHKMLEMLEPKGFALKRPSGSGASGKEALGFFLSDSTIADLQKMSLLSIDRGSVRSVLLVGSAAARKRGGDALVERLRSLGANPEYQVLPEHMNRNLRLVSSQDHERIATEMSAWMTTHLGTAEGYVAEPVHREDASQTASASGRSLNEQPHFFGEQDSLFGILTLPDDRMKARDRPAIIILNAGPGTRIGPHRQYVRMAREWAKLGFPVFRVDLSGSGDSTVPIGTIESDPYPQRAVADVHAAMEFLKRRYSFHRFIAAGVCSGADIAFRAGVEESGVVGVLVMNPRTFALYNIPTLEEIVRVHNLGATVAAGKNWRKLLRGDAGWKGTVDRIKQVSATAVTSAKQKLKKLLDPDPSSAPKVANVPADMQKMLRRGVDTLLVVGERDVGIMYTEIFYRNEMRALESIKGYRRVNFKGADHLFTSLYAQELMIKAVTEHLIATYG